MELHGVEPDADGLDLARDQLLRRGCRPDLREGSAYCLPFDEDRFDVAYLTDVIEHLDDYRGALSEAFRVLQPGGVIVVSTPYRQPHTKWDPLHVHEFDGGELKDVLAERFNDVAIWTAWPMSWVGRWKAGRMSRELINVGCRLGWNPYRRLYKDLSESYGQLVARAVKPPAPIRGPLKNHKTPA